MSHWPRAAAHYVLHAPVTFSWLLLLFLTTDAQNALPRIHLRTLLNQDSTNLHHLASDPLRVLGTSLLWIDGRSWWPYLIVFCLFLAPAERWLGSWRFVAAGLIAHVVGTYVSQGFLYLQIQEAEVSPRLLHTRDIGVSYFMVGIMGLLTYRIPYPWRWLYLGTGFAGLVIAWAIHPHFTEVGHLCSLFVGLALYPLCRSRLPATSPRIKN